MYRELFSVEIRDKLLFMLDDINLESYSQYKKDGVIIIENRKNTDEANKDQACVIRSQCFFFN